MDALSLVADDIVYAVLKLEPEATLPEWAVAGDWYSITRTSAELSIVCAAGTVPDDISAERDWRKFSVQGQLDFALIGILARLVTPLAEANISVFAISSFDTDHLLVRQGAFAGACEAFQRAGIVLI